MHFGMCPIDDLTFLVKRLIFFTLFSQCIILFVDKFELRRYPFGITKKIRHTINLHILLLLNDTYMQYL